MRLSTNNIAFAMRRNIVSSFQSKINSLAKAMLLLALLLLLVPSLRARIQRLKCREKDAQNVRVNARLLT
jgi:hypothetical protein